MSQYTKRDWGKFKDPIQAHCAISHFQKLPGAVDILISILQMKRLRLREVKSLAWGHRGRHSRAGMQTCICRTPQAPSGGLCLCQRRIVLPQPHLSLSRGRAMRVSSWPPPPCSLWQGQREKESRSRIRENYILTLWSQPSVPGFLLTTSYS